MAVVVYNLARQAETFTLIERKFYLNCFFITITVFAIALFGTLTNNLYIIKSKLLCFTANVFFMAYFFKKIHFMRLIIWALWIETLFYCCFPFALYLVKKKKYIAVILIFILCYLSPQFIGRKLYHLGFLWNRLDRCIPFILGLFLAIIHGNNLVWGKVKKYFRRISTLCLPLTVFMMYLWKIQEPLSKVVGFWSTGVYYAAVAVIFFFILGGSLVPKSAASRIFSSIPLRILGSISYSTYIIHIIIINATYNLFVPYNTEKMIAQFFLSLTLTFVAASITYYTFERKIFQF